MSSFGQGPAALTAQERELLTRGLAEWGGPAKPNDDIARAIGFDNVDALYKQRKRLADQIRRGEQLSAVDWRRALLATEIVFASDVVGSGWDWSTTVGYSDEETIQLLRSIQGKLVGIVHRASTRLTSVEVKPATSAAPKPPMPHGDLP